MKQSLVAILSVFSINVFAQVVSSKTLGGVEAVQMDITVDADECVKNLRVESQVWGGPYAADIRYEGYCEVKLQDGDSVIYSDSVASAVNKDIYLGLSAKRYYLRVAITPNPFRRDEMVGVAAATLRKSVPKKTYSVRAIRTVVAP